MASATLTLKDRADVNNVFTLTGQTGRTADYIDTDTTLAAPLAISIKQEPAAPGAIANDRGTISVSRTVIDSNGKPFTGSVKVIWSAPRTDAFAATQLRDLFAYAKSYIADANVQALEDGIIP